MTEPSRKEQALTDNYQAFEKLLPDLVKTACGKFALMHDTQLVGLFESAGEAHAAGRETFDDSLFSVQKVEESAINLGFFSYARYCRAA
jgi:hypothetical protein